MFFKHVRCVTSISSLLVSLTSVDSKFDMFGTMCGSGTSVVAGDEYFNELDITKETGAQFIVYI